MSASLAGHRIQPALPACALLARAQSSHRHRHRARSRPPAYQESSDTEGGIQLPEVHKLLQVNQAASRDTCLRAYERLTDHPPEAGYSQVRPGFTAAADRQAGSSWPMCQCCACRRLCMPAGLC